MRGKVLFYIFLSAILFLLVPYYRLQIVEGDKYRSYIDSLGMRKIEIPPIRGKILDRKGRVLAQSERVLYASLWGTKLPDFEKLSEIVGEDRALKLILGYSVEVSEGEAKTLEEIGVPVYKGVKRIYTGDAAHVVGYVGSDGNGKFGVEKKYNEELKGSPGSQLLMINAAGKIVGKLVNSPPINGSDITLTIDLDIQKYAQKLLSNYHGAVILVDVKSGEILALASSPSFDPNKLSEGLQLRDWKKMFNDPSSPFLNRAISALYPPGSAIKPFIAFSYLMNKENDLSVEDKEGRVVDCKGKFIYKTKSGKVAGIYKDWLLSGHGVTDLRKAIRVSCNVYFYTIGLEIGIETLKRFSDYVKLDKKTGIDLPGEAAGLFPSKSWKFTQLKEDWYPGDTILISIGQGYLRLTPLELLMFYTLLANEGVEYVPHVVKKIGKTEVLPKTMLKFDAPKEVWEFLREAMIDVTTHPGNLREEGTAYRVFKDFPIIVAGKTGTAETRRGKAPHSWFVGYAPAHDPEVAILVVVEYGGPGSKIAAPIAKRILAKYFSIPLPTEDVIENRDEEKGQKSRNAQTGSQSVSHGSMVLSPPSTENELRNESSNGGERSHENGTESGSGTFNDGGNKPFPFSP